MNRVGLSGLVLTFLFAGVIGCGNSDIPPAEERPGVKQRQEMQKEKKQQSYMKPGEK
jgi:hypothetical protein